MNSRRRTPPALVATAGTVLAVGLLVMLWPVLTNPIVGDDFYWYLDAAGRSDGSYVGVVTRHLDDLERASRGAGRVVVLAFILRGLSMLMISDLAVWSGTPFVVGQAVLKGVLLALIMAAVVGFLRGLRHRRTDGSLARLSGRTVGVVVLVSLTLMAAGAQAHGQFRNGWTSYAVLTWGAALVIVGAVALLVWLTRLSARHGRGATVAGVVVAVLVAIFLNTSYELYYVAVPLILAALAQQPLLDRATDPDGRTSRRARLWVGGAFLVAFATVFVGIRAWVAALCAQRRCYEGSELDLGPQTLVTAGRNLLTAVPGGARNELAADLREVGLADQMPGWASPTSVLVAVVSGLALVVLVRALARPGSDPQQRQDEARLLVLAALVPLAAALGTALIMALSSQSHDIVVSVGSPYRSTMVTWTMLALTAGMVLTALQLTRPRIPAPTLTAAALVVLLASHTVAANYPALRAARVAPDNQAVSAVHREVVLGDPSPEADERRCRTLDDVRSTVRSTFSQERVPAGAEAAFRHYHGGVYCSESQPSAEDDGD